VRAIDRLRKRFPPPKRPIARGFEDEWPLIQQRVGSVLPRDYKDFINAYGTVLVSQLVVPLNPFAKNEYRNLLSAMGPILSAERTMKEAFGDEGCPYPLWFEPGGLLPWATTGNGGTLYWLTKGHADQWSVIVRADRGPEFEPFEGSMIDFLLAFLNGTLEERLLLSHPDDELRPTIEPLR
jgi:hypothetical protein